MWAIVSCPCGRNAPTILSVITLLESRDRLQRILAFVALLRTLSSLVTRNNQLPTQLISSRFTDVLASTPFARFFTKIIIRSVHCSKKWRLYSK